MTNLSNQSVAGKDDQDEDRLSSLPDEILCHILSFVPTKSAYKMRVFSKSWKDLLTVVPALDFSEMPHSLLYNRRLTPEQVIHFKSFVNKVLRRNNASELRHLHLCCGPFGWDNDTSCVKSWMRAILKRDIREVTITSFCAKEAHILPTKFFSRENLVALKLSGKFAIGDPSSLYLPNIEVVRFGGVQFPNDEFLKRFLPGCPVIKELLISHCTGITNTVYVESLSLRRLYILRVAATSSKKVGITIKAPNLGYLSLDDTINEHFVCDGLNSLVEADLSVEYEEEDYLLWVLYLVSGVKTLRLMNRMICKEYGYAREAPFFDNLTHLELHNAYDLCTFLKHTPKLNCLILKQAQNASKYLEFERVLVCVSSIERVTLYWFEGSKDEMAFVSYFLKFASKLKEMKIYMLPKTMKDVFPKLLEIPCSSDACQIKGIPFPVGENT